MHYQGTTPEARTQAMKSTTKHGFLVALGWVARQLGLQETLNRHLQIKQKIFAHTPVDKVVEALVGILGNCKYMKDLNVDPEPIVADVAVAQAWGQEKFAHYSTVCATFAKMTAENVAQLSNALAEVQAPLIQQEVAALAGPDGTGLVVVDIDLTGQKVRGETKQYTGTDFGYIQGQLARGYQIVVAFLSGVQERFAIAGTLKSGKAHTQSGACLLEILPTVEARLGRPHRRVEWVERCIAEQKAKIRQLHQEWITCSGKGSGAKKQGLRRQIQAAAQAVAGLVLCLRQYRRDNATNPTPRRIALRADSHFGSAEAVQRLLELGYELALKSYSGSHPAFKQHFDAVPAADWIEVEQNRYATETHQVPALTLLGSFPLRHVALRRWDGDGREVRSVILTTLTATNKDTVEVVRFYHRRQTIEAGIQECKGTFHFGAPRLRKYEANAAFTELVLFAFNLIRWARCFLHTTSEKLTRAKSRLLVKIAARCRATIRQAGDTLRILFSRGTPLAGVEISIRASALAADVSKRWLSGYSRDT